MNIKGILDKIFRPNPAEGNPKTSPETLRRLAEDHSSKPAPRPK